MGNRLHNGIVLAVNLLPEVQKPEPETNADEGQMELW